MAAMLGCMHAIAWLAGIRLALLYGLDVVCSKARGRPANWTLLEPTDARPIIHEMRPRKNRRLPLARPVKADRLSPCDRRVTPSGLGVGPAPLRRDYSH